MRRRLFTILSALSLVTCALWLRSYRAADSWGWQGPHFIVAVHSSEGRLGVYIVSREHGKFDDPLNGWTYCCVTPDDLDDIYFNLSGGSVRWSGFTATWVSLDERKFRNLIVPDWSFAIVCLAAPLSILSCGQRRPKPNECVACGYDLRATPERCPECGRAVTKHGLPLVMCGRLFGSQCGKDRAY